MPWIASLFSHTPWLSLQCLPTGRSALFNAGMAFWCGLVNEMWEVWCVTPRQKPQSQGIFFSPEWQSAKFRVKDRVEPSRSWLVVHGTVWLRNTLLLLLAVEILPLSVTPAKHSLFWLTDVNCIVLAWAKESWVNYDSELWDENSSQFPAMVCRWPLFPHISFSPLSQTEWTSSQQQPSPPPKHSLFSLS